MTARSETITQSIQMPADMTIQFVGDCQALLAGAATSDTEIDLSDVADLDTAGLQLLLVVKRDAERNGRVVSFVGSTPSLEKVLAVVGLDGELEPLSPPDGDSTGISDSVEADHA